MSELAELNIEVSGGTSTKLLTAGKYCDRNIVIIASGGSGGGGDLPEKAFLIAVIDLPIVVGIGLLKIMEIE